MAKQVIYQMESDLSGTPYDDDKGETLSFGLDGRSFTIDLTDAEASEFRSFVGRYVECATQVRSAGKPSANGGRRGGSPRAGRMSADDRAAISANEVRHGRAPLAPRGRVRAEAIEQWEADGRPNVAEVEARITVSAEPAKPARKAAKATAKPTE